MSPLQSNLHLDIFIKILRDGPYSYVFELILIDNSLMILVLYNGNCNAYMSYITDTTMLLFRFIAK